MDLLLIFFPSLVFAFCWFWQFGFVFSCGSLLCILSCGFFYLGCFISYTPRPAFHLEKCVEVSWLLMAPLLFLVTMDSSFKSFFTVSSVGFWKGEEIRNKFLWFLQCHLERGNPQFFHFKDEESKSCRSKMTCLDHATTCDDNLVLFPHESQDFGN